MIEFVIISDDLIFKAKVEKSIHSCMTKNPLSYQIKNNDFQLNNRKIYIIDLEKKSSLDDIIKINHININNLIICITAFHEKIFTILQHHLLVFDVIDKFDDFYKHLLKSLDKCIKIALKEKSILKLKQKNIHYSIPLEDIEEIISIADKTLIKSSDLIRNKYIYQLDISINELKKELNENFVQINDNIIVNTKKNNFNFNLKFKLYNKKHNRSYNQKYKSKILLLYYGGKTISQLSKEYKPSYTTIRNWIMKDKNDKLINEFKDKAHKFDEIYEIVNK